MENTILNTESLEKVSGGVTWESVKKHPIKATLITLGSLLAA